MANEHESDDADLAAQRKLKLVVHVDRGVHQRLVAESENEGVSPKEYVERLIETKVGSEPVENDGD